MTKGNVPNIHELLRTYIGVAKSYMAKCHVWYAANGQNLRPPPERLCMALLKHPWVGITNRGYNKSDVGKANRTCIAHEIFELRR
jgi:hypothetical protein